MDGANDLTEPPRQVDSVTNVFGMPEEEYYRLKEVRHATETFKNSRGLQMFAQSWFPEDKKLRAIMFLFHGYGTDSSWLIQVDAIDFARLGLAVYAMDYEGHGRSAGLRCGIRKFDYLVEDTASYFQAVRERAEVKGLPAFCYGQSLGCAVIIQALRRHPTMADGAILEAPMCKISEEMQPPQAVIYLLSWLAYVFPDAAVVPSKDVLAGHSFRDPVKKQLAQQNPMRYKMKPRLGFALALLQTTQDIGEHMEEVSFPFLVLHGQLDDITDPAVSKELYERASSTDKEIQLFPESWHALLGGEPEETRKIIWARIVEWLDRHIGKLSVNS